MAVKSPFVWIYIIYRAIPLPMGIISRFTTTNKATVNILVKMFFWAVVLYLWGRVPGVELKDGGVCGSY